MKFLTLEVPEIEMTEVPAGEFTMGRGEHTLTMEQFAEAMPGMRSSPAHGVHLDAYEIGRYPVTNEQYQVFVQDTGHRPPPDWKTGFFKKTPSYPKKAAAASAWVRYCLLQPDAFDDAKIQARISR